MLTDTEKAEALKIMVAITDLKDSTAIDDRLCAQYPAIESEDLVSLWREAFDRMKRAKTADPLTITDPAFIRMMEERGGASIRQRNHNTSSMTANSKEEIMSHAPTDHINDKDTEWEDRLSMAIPAASFLLRALQGLRLADETITVEDLLGFADDVRKDMGLMIGTEENLKEIIDIGNQIDFYHMQNHHKDADHLSEKILQAQQNLITNDRDFPF